MGRHLREPEADERGIGRILAHFRDVVDVGAADAQRPTDAVVDVGLDAPDARAPEVLPLLQVWRRNRDVRDRILDAIVEPCRAPGDAGRRDHVDAELAAHQPLRTERRIRERHHRTQREAPVELVERRRAEPRRDISPDRQPLVDAIQRAEPRTDHRVALVGEDGVAHRARRQHRLGVVCVVVPPAVEPRARGHRHVRRAERTHPARTSRAIAGCRRRRGAASWSSPSPGRTHPRCCRRPPSGSRCRRSARAVPPSARDHCTMPPNASVGTV